MNSHNTLRRLVRLWSGLALALAAPTIRGTAAETHAELVQRFRPYYKFSIDQGDEPCHPCSWQWFVDHSELWRGSVKLQTPTNLLELADADIRRTGSPTAVLQLRPRAGFRTGEPWSAVIDEGAGLYAQAEDVDSRHVVL